MPPRKAVDLIDKDLRDWLHQRLKDSGFSGYLEITEELNARLAERGEELRIGKSAVHNYGQEYEHFARAEEEASAWAVSWMEGNGLEDEAKRHNVLFQMITTLAFKVMKAQMTKEGDEINPQELHFLGRMLKDVMSSSGIREKLTADERSRIADEAAERAKSDIVADITSNAAALGFTDTTVAAIKSRILMGEG